MKDFNERSKNQNESRSLFNCSTIRGWWPLKSEDPDQDEDQDAVININ